LRARVVRLDGDDLARKLGDACKPRPLSRRKRRARMQRPPHAAQEACRLDASLHRFA
jgi:hypothetical protein